MDERLRATEADSLERAESAEDEIARLITDLHAAELVIEAARKALAEIHLNPKSHDDVAVALDIVEVYLSDALIAYDLETK